jgi:hypothetical protein
MEHDQRARRRLIDRGLDPDHVIGDTEATGSVDLAAFYDLLGTMAASEKAGQSPTYSLARLALRSSLPSEIADLLFLAYNQQSAEEAGHGDKVFGNAYFSMGGRPPGGERSVFGDGDDVASGLAARDDPRENAWVLCTAAATLGGIETAALQRLFPFVGALCERWDHPIARDLARQIHDVVRPEESRHVLTWRYVFHHLVAPKGQAHVDQYLVATNAGRTQLAAPILDRKTFERIIGSQAPSARQLLGKDRALHS